MRRLALTFALLLAAAYAPAQQPSSAIAGFGPLDPAPLANLTVPQIIERMGQRESEFEHARDQYTFRQSVKMDQIDDTNNKPNGEWQEVSDVTFDNAGHRTEHIVFAPGNTLRDVILTENDVNDIKYRLPFVLTTAQLPDYNITYTGQQKVDDLQTFVFDVAPKTIVKGHRYLQGKVWVDQQDFEIVLVNGITGPQDFRPNHADLSPPFTTYYQQIDGKYWFPTYTRAEGVLHFPPQNGALGMDVHLRATVKYTDYKRFRSTVTIRYGNEVSDDTTKPQSTPPKP